MSAFSVSGLVGRYASRLATGPLLVVMVALFVISLVVPDPLPFVDEILLGIAALMLARRKREPVADADADADAEASGARPADSEAPPRGGRTVDGEARPASH